MKSEMSGRRRIGRRREGGRKGKDMRQSKLTHLFPSSFDEIDEFIESEKKRF